MRLPSRAPSGDPTRSVLVSDHVDGRSRSAVAAVRALGQAGYSPLVTVSGGSSAAAASRYCAGVLPVPPVDSPDYPGAVSKHLAALPGASVLAASDAVLVALGRPGAELVDKAVLPARAEAAGLRVPPTREFASTAELLGAAGALDYPLVVKAAVKTRATEVARRVDSATALGDAVAALAGAVVTQPFAGGTMRAVCGVLHEGHLIAAVHQRYERIWPPGCGTASAAVTTDPDTELEERLPRLLGGHSGVFQVQLIDDFVIDVNPRVYGSLPLAVTAGANLPAIACDADRGLVPDEVVRGRPGVRYRWLEGDVRRVLHGVAARELSLRAAVRALAPRRGTAHSVESLTDPGPVLARLTDVVRRRMA
jgi:predicted ATP-grasp superfamily ATP-dependent carboligase